MLSPAELLKGLSDEASEIFSILNAVVTDQSAAFGGADAVMRMAASSLDRSFSIFYWDPKVPRVVCEVFEGLGFSVTHQSKFQIEVRMSQCIGVRIKFQHCLNSVGSRTRFVDGVRVLGCSDLTNSVIAELQVNKDLAGLFALTELFKNGSKYGGDSDDHKGVISYFVEEQGSVGLYQVIRDEFRSSMTKAYLPQDCTAESMQDDLLVIEEYAQYPKFLRESLDIGFREDIQDCIEELCDRFQMRVCNGPMSEVGLNRDVYSGLIKSIKLTCGEFRVLEEFLSRSRSSFLITAIYAKFGDLDQYMTTLKYHLEVLFYGTGVSVHATKFGDGVWVDYGLGDVSGHITIVNKSVSSGDVVFPYRVDIAKSEESALRNACVESLLDRLEKDPNAYDLVCAVELLDDHVDRAQAFGVPANNHWHVRCAKCVESVPDFGMAISLDAVTDDRLLGSLDIFEYLAKFELLAGVPVSLKGTDGVTRLFAK